VKRYKLEDPNKPLEIMCVSERFAHSRSVCVRWEDIIDVLESANLCDKDEKKLANLLISRAFDTGQI